MKKWTPEGWVAFILACTVPFFLVTWTVASLFAYRNPGDTPMQSDLEDLDRLKVWVGLIANIITGLLVWLSNNRKSGKNDEKLDNRKE